MEIDYRLAHSRAKNLLMHTNQMAHTQQQAKQQTASPFDSYALHKVKDTKSMCVLILSYTQGSHF